MAYNSITNIARQLHVAVRSDEETGLQVVEEDIHFLRSEKAILEMLFDKMISGRVYYGSACVARYAVGHADISR